MNPNQAPPTKYKRLARGRAKGLSSAFVTSRGELWLGPDHLLDVTLTSYREDYRRYFYRDIQALIVERTVLGAAANVVLLLIGAACAGLALASSIGQALSVTLMVCAGFFVACAAVNAAMGPTCNFRIRTGVQSQVIPGVDRVRRANKIIAQMRPLIVEAQGGELDPADLARAANWSFSGRALPPTVAADKLSATIHFVVFGLTGAFGAALWMLAHLQNVIVLGTALGLLIGSALFAVIAMARPANNRVDGSLNVICGVILGGDGLAAFAAYVGFMISIMVATAEKGPGGRVNNIAALGRGLDRTLAWLGGFPLFQIVGAVFAGLSLLGLVRLAVLRVPILKGFETAPARAAAVPLRHESASSPPHAVPPASAEPTEEPAAAQAAQAPHDAPGGGDAPQ